MIARGSMTRPLDDRSEMPVRPGLPVPSVAAEGTASPDASLGHALPNTTPSKQDGEYYWLWVVCLLGLDYFSTLAYQPTVTFQVAGRLGPIATALVVLVLLVGVLPVYCYLAG